MLGLASPRTVAEVLASDGTLARAVAKGADEDEETAAKLLVAT